MPAECNQFRRDGNPDFFRSNRADVEADRVREPGQTDARQDPSACRALKMSITLRFDPIMPT